jgi:hypothetical protein
MRLAIREQDTVKYSWGQKTAFIGGWRAPPVNGVSGLQARVMVLLHVC